MYFKENVFFLELTNEGLNLNYFFAFITNE